TAIQNVRFEVAGELVYVYYDLIGPADRIHKISLTIRRETDRLFIYQPVNITGDVGTIVFPGTERRITWDFTKEFPEGLAGDDYYFVVETEAEKEEGMSSLVWIGGGVAVAGVLAIILLSGGSSSDTPPAAGFPPPPGRP
ncbi:MAG: hypothetical protein KAJ12_12715, partial [Bacteroidetes bacterium]|nr:hypothetical protein [Bacteroidota bacterium]